MDQLLPNLLTLLMLILLQAVLGFDNLLYISLESKRAPLEAQKRVRTLGIGIAIFLRIALLFLLLKLKSLFITPWFSVDSHAVSGAFTFEAILTLFGGGFIIYTALKEIFHMMNLEEAHGEKKESASVFKVVALIVMMNAIFSFDSILSAMAIANQPGQEWIMVVAIVASGIAMIVLADGVSNFLQKNRMYEVLGLFVLFIVGILLLSEGGHKAHLSFWGHEVHAMSKATFYFVIAVLVLIDIVQGRYQKKLMLAKKAAHPEPLQ